MVELAVSIYKYRIKFINNINEYIGSIFKDIAGDSGLYIKYIPNIDIGAEDKIKDIMLDKLENNLDKEIIYGSTLVGPHRDDFSFQLDNNDLLLYGSQGQQKMAILALKLSEIDVFYHVCGEYPVVLLDDLFSELDLVKRNKIIKFLNRNIQTIVTTTDLKNIDKRFIKNANIFMIDDGKLVE